MTFPSLLPRTRGPRGHADDERNRVRASVPSARPWETTAAASKEVA